MKLQTLALVLALAIPSVAAADGPVHEHAAPTAPARMKPAPATVKTTTAPTAMPVKVGQLTAAEQKQIIHDHHVNLMEVDMGKLAKKKATAPVRKYGAMLVVDHLKSDKEYAALANKKGLNKIPAEVPATETEQVEHQAMMDKLKTLKTLKGAEFDTMYLMMMVEGHDKELAKNATAQAAAVDADVKALLSKKQDSLQKHADKARELQSQLAAKATTATK